MVEGLLVLCGCLIRDFFLKRFYFVLRVLVCVSLCTCVQVPAEARQVLEAPGARVTAGWELLDGSIGSRTPVIFKSIKHSDH